MERARLIKYKMLLVNRLGGLLAMVQRSRAPVDVVAIRAIQDLTQAGIAERASITRASINAIE
jgi:hypothetical protein